MNAFKFFNQIKSSPVGIMAIGISSTIILCGSYRVIIKPELDKRRRQRAESYADFIFKQEMKHIEN